MAWQPLAFAEIEPFCCAVLDQHSPRVKNLGNVEHFHGWSDAIVDALVGGSPCQPAEADESLRASSTLDIDSL